MFLRWLHKTWKVLWIAILSGIVITALASLLLFGLLQLPQSKVYIANQLTELFNDSYEGTLQIDRISGRLPFHANLHGVNIYLDEKEEQIIGVEQVNIDIRLWELIQRNITIQSFSLEAPKVKLERDGEEDIFTVEKAFRPRSKEIRDPAAADFSRFQLYAPSVQIRHGELIIEERQEPETLPDKPGSPDSTDSRNHYSVKDIDGALNIELTADQQILDIDYLRGDVQDSRIGKVDLRGQIFSDAQYLEFNGFRIQTDDSRLEFTAEATPVRLFSPDFTDQLQTAEFRLDIKNSWIHSRKFSHVVPGSPFGDNVLELELFSEGTLQSFFIDRFTGNIGESTIQLTGRFRDIDTPDFSYQATVNNFILQPGELRALAESYLPELEFDEQELSYLSRNRWSGQLNGDLTQITTDFTIETPRGNLNLGASLYGKEPVSYQAVLEVDSLDLSPAFTRYLDRNLLDGTLTLSGSGLSPEEFESEFSAEFNQGYVNHIEFTSSRLNGSVDNRTITHELNIENGDTRFRSSGQIRHTDPVWAVSLRGGLSNIDLNYVMQSDDYPETSLNLEYSTDLEWSNSDDLFGRVNFDVAESLAGPYRLQPHQFYADLDSPSEIGGERNLRLTSTFLDAEMSGDIYPGNLLLLFRHWQSYIGRQIAEEIVMDTTRPAESGVGQNEISPASLNLRLQVKDMELLQKYFYEEPPLASNANISLNLNADDDRLLLTGTMNDSNFRFEDLNSESVNASITASFQFAEKLRDYGTLDLQLNAENYSWKNFDFSEGFVNASLRDDSLTLNHSSAGAGRNVTLDLVLVSRLLPDRIDTEIRDFKLGNSEYEWVAGGTPKISYHDDRRLELENVLFSSGEERIEIDGTYSGRTEDRVDYLVRNLNLQRISELIDGRVNFGGVMNGDFITRSLTRIPIFEGDLGITRGTLDGRLIGDIRLNSNYSSDGKRFNTRITAITDPDRYPQYYAENDSIGQNLVFDGYVSIPDFENPDQEFFHFEADLKEIDMWIATVIVPNIITEAEGSSSGSGYIRGSLTDFDFNASFDVEDVTAVPIFLNTTYTVNGNLEFNRHSGLTFNNMDLRDGRGGSGRLYGTVDLDDFSETSYLDLTLDLNNLHFMNNPYDPDIPFYANASGSGQARITGSNFDPFLRTTQPIVISPGSRISVPAVEDTELQQSQNFIQFVDSFDWSSLSDRDLSSGRSRDGESSSDPGSLTFVERFTMDLQFIAEEPVNFRLIFDRVTNEILTANGVGQIRLNLTDQNFSLFGRMNITGGNYQFVAGDIISRRFQLTEGGSIIWEGDPANARLNVNATYRSRPDITSLVTSGAAGRMEGSQRFPIDLVLNIGGTLSELENDFFFQVPSSIEGTLDPTLLTQINALNNNEDEKIIQATSILLSGNFIPLASGSSEGGTGMALRESLTGGTVVVNPLITSQVINPLLSDQINSLLRSDMALDIDFNLTPYNQVDLGVALRLYDDRLILRRDGQITGPYSDIGDLGATYRINRIFALTAFHRQDPTLANTSATEPRQVQEMNGVGVEAQFQFNTWREFRRSVSNAFRRLFGRRDRNETFDGGTDSFAFD